MIREVSLWLRRHSEDNKDDEKRMHYEKKTSWVNLCIDKGMLYYQLLELSPLNTKNVIFLFLYLNIEYSFTNYMLVSNYYTIITCSLNILKTFWNFINIP